MATLTQMAASSALDMQQANSPVYRGKATTEPKANGTTKRARDTKYRHVFATHSSSRTSCLSQDAEKIPSFVGFRNLMILVLSMNSLLPRIAADG
jgi:diacylglycerol O-acyltransferase-1